MTQEQLNAIQEQTKKITNPKLLEVMRTLKKCAEEKQIPNRSIRWIISTI